MGDYPSMYLALLVSVLLGLGAAAPYVPGTPGGPWTADEILIMKAKLFTMFGRMDNAPKHLRLGFHDCIKYADGTGGCDGCLNWHGMDQKLPAVAGGRNLPVEAGAGNNGLGKTVRDLEQIYTIANFPWGAPALTASLQELGWSRADLWAFSSMMAVEFGVLNNNLKCDEGNGDQNRGSSWFGCSHHLGDPDCKVNIERSFQFQTGRSDCTEHDEEFPYKATKEEKHPSATDAGRKTVEYFKTEFPDLTGRDIVALMGAHTMGQPHFDISQFPYQWTSKGGRMFNNDYYRNMVGEDRYHIYAEPNSNCELIGNAFGEKPKTQWLAHTRMTNVKGGPVFWIHRNHVCPPCMLEDQLEVLKLMDWEKDCCHNKPEGSFCRPDRESADMEDDNLNQGCERMKFIIGMDEIAINAEMGLYKQFEVDDDGIIYGCRGLEIFNTTMRGDKGLRAVWSVAPGKWGPMEPECEKQTIEHPAGSGEPLYAIFEEYASNQKSFVNDFFLALEKMSANGYPEGLTNAPDHWTDVTCPIPADNNKPFTCYKKEAAGSGDPFVIQASWGQARGYVIQQDPESGESLMGPADLVSGPTLYQQWVWSESGTQLINLGSGTPLLLDGYSSWQIETFENWQGVHTQIRSAYNPSKGLDAWLAKVDQSRVIVGNAHHGHNQRWNIISMDQLKSEPCVEEAVPTGTPFKITNVKSKKTLQVDGGSVKMSKNGGHYWQWAVNNCGEEKVYLFSVSEGKILAADCKTVAEDLEGNRWSYNSAELTLSSESGHLTDTKRKGQRIDRLRRNKKGQPWKFFRWNLA